MNPKKNRTRISYIIKEEYPDASGKGASLHQQGINSMALDYDSYVQGKGGHLYTASRDSLINRWDLELFPHISTASKSLAAIPQDGSHGASSPITITRSSKDQYRNENGVYISRSLMTSRIVRVNHLNCSLPNLSVNGNPSAGTPEHAFPTYKRNRVSFGSNAHDSNIVRTDRYEKQIEFNMSLIKPSSNAQLDHSLRGHTNWVNDICLVNNGARLISCSSDRTVCIWNTTDTKQGAVYLGMHNDYVKRLAAPKHRNWVCSGGLDRQLLLWDLAEGRSQHQVLFFDDSPFGSIYALATNPIGSIIASGTPQKIVRIFDPRSGNAIVQKLVGHSDVIRDLLMSDDGKWILSASSDCTIKLWSLAMPNHCVTTYNHSDTPIWCLASNSPSLNTFWAGAKDGWVYKVSCSQIEDDFRDTDCVALCRESGPVLKIVGIEDSYIWTSTSSSTVNRWPDIPPGDSAFRIPASCFCRHEETNDTETESLCSRPLSIRSSGFVPENGQILPEHSRSSSPDGLEYDSDVTALWTSPVEEIKGIAGIKNFFLLNTKRHVITQNQDDWVCIWDIICCTKIKVLGKVDFGNACEIENTTEWVSNWCTIDIKLGDITVHLDEGRCIDSEGYYQDIIPFAQPPNSDKRINLGKWVLTFLLFNYMTTLYPEKSVFIKPTPLIPKSPVYDNIPTLRMSLAVPYSSLIFLPNGEKMVISTTTPTCPVVSPSNEDESEGSSHSSGSNENKEKHPKSFLGKMKKFRIGKVSNRKVSADSFNTAGASILKSTEKLDSEEDIIDYEDTPFIHLNQKICIQFSVEDSPSVFSDIFRSPIGKFEPKTRLLSELAPWIHDWIVAGNPPAKDLAKLSFVLERHPQSKLPEIDQDTNRLTANRMLRVKKVLQYLAEKIKIQLDPKCTDPDETQFAEKTPGISGRNFFIEIYCQGKLIHPRYTLATIKYMLCKNGGPDLMFHYLEKS